MNQDPKELLKQYQPKELKVIKPDLQLCMIRFSPCGKILAAGGYDSTIRRFDATSDQLPEQSPLRGHGGWVQALAFHADGKRLFSADSWGKLCCWPYADADAKPIWTLADAHEGWIRGLSLSPDGQQLATAGNDRKIRLWSTEDGKRMREFAGHAFEIFAVAFHPDGKSLISGDLKGVVKHWDLNSGQCTRELDAGVLYRSDRLQDVGGVRRLEFDREGKFLACAGTQPKGGANVQGTPAILWFDWQSGKVKHTLKVGNDSDGFVYDLHLHTAGFVMAVTSGNPGSGKFFFQRPGDEQPFFVSPKMPNCQSLSVHPNGQRVVVAAVNGGSNGNGRPLNKNKEYSGNFSPLHIWEMPSSAKT